MRQKLFTIEDSFIITGRGIVVVGKLEANSPPCRIGNKIVLVNPSKIELVTEISGLEQIKLIDIEHFNSNKIGIMLKGVTKKEDAPVGTEVFLVI